MECYTQIVNEQQVPQAILRCLSKLVLNESDRHSHIAFAMNGKRIVSIGRNTYEKTHPTQAFWANKVGETKKNCLHAELHALIRARSKVESLFVFRINKVGKWLLSKPCRICALAIASANVEVFHS